MIFVSVVNSFSPDIAKKFLYEVVEHRPPLKRFPSIYTMPLAMAVGQKRRKTGTAGGRKRKAGKKPLLIDRGRLFLLSGVLAILCVLLLFINVLYGGEASAACGSGSIFAGEARPVPAAPAAPSGGSSSGPTDAAPGPAAGGSGPAALSAAGTPGASGTPAAAPVASRSSVPSPESETAVTGGEPLAIQPREHDPLSGIPQAQDGARLAFVIDDAGQSRAALRRYLAVPLPLTIAVLPKLANTKESAAMVRAAGKELMLHQPMQAEKLDLWAGPGAITPGMGLGEIKALIAENLAELGEGVRGLNNHEGSLITEDEVRIGAVLDAAQERGLFFMDSRTSAQTKAPDAARIRGMQILERDVFIDNVLEREAMLQQIREGLVLANKQGSAIMIGHVDKSADILPDLLTELAPLLRERGYQLVTPSQLLDR